MKSDSDVNPEHKILSEVAANYCLLGEWKKRKNSAVYIIKSR